MFRLFLKGLHESELLKQSPSAGCAPSAGRCEGSDRNLCAGPFRRDYMNPSFSNNAFGTSSPGTRSAFGKVQWVRKSSKMRRRSIFPRDLGKYGFSKTADFSTESTPETKSTLAPKAKRNVERWNEMRRFRFSNG